MDINNLVKSAPGEFYQSLFIHIENSQERLIQISYAHFYEYKEILEKNGWWNITISHLLKADIEYLEKVNNSSNKKYKNI